MNRRLILSGLVFLLIAGCQRQATPPATVPAGESHSTEVDRKRDGDERENKPKKQVSDFIKGDRFCKFVVDSLKLSDFQKLYPDAVYDEGASRPDIRYSVWKDGEMFRFAFHRDVLVQIIEVVPRTEQSAQRWFDRYETGLGPADSDTVPQHMLNNNVHEYRYWLFEELDLEVTITDLVDPASGQILITGCYLSPSRRQEYYHDLAQTDHKTGDSDSRQSYEKPGSEEGLNARPLGNEPVADSPDGFTDDEWEQIAQRAKQMGIVRDSSDTVRLAKGLRIMKSIFADAGIPHPTARQLFNGVEALCGGGFHSLGPEKVEQSLRTTVSIAKQSGVPVATREQLESLE